MFKPLYTLITLLVSINSVSAQLNPGARQIALSNSDVSLSDDVFSVFNNPSGLSQMNWREIGIYYSPAPFGLKELSNGYICYHEPAKYGSFGIGVMTYGFDLFRENQIVMAYSSFYKNFYFGGAIKYYMLSIKNYGNANAFLFDIGSLVYIADNVKWGINLDNLSHSTIGNDKSQLPYSLSTGLSYIPAEHMLLNAAAEKYEGSNYTFNLGVEYNLLKYIYLRSGFSTEPDRFSAGIGLNFSYIQFDYAVFTHLELGLTHQAGFIIHFSDDEPRTTKIKNIRLKQ